MAGVPAETYNFWLTYDNTDWGFSALLAYHYFGSSYLTADDFNAERVVEPAKFGDLALSQTFFDGMANLYFGINNITDRQYGYGGYLIASRGTRSFGVEPGRTYFGGVKLKTDFDRMKIPSKEDLGRMRRYLYGAVDRQMDRFSRLGNWIQETTGLR
jgi:iron complex outermembrane receptor protein